MYLTMFSIATPHLRSLASHASSYLSVAASLLQALLRLMTIQGGCAGIG